MDIMEFVRNEIKALPKEDQIRLMKEVEEMIKYEDSLGEDAEED